jgi:probable H4MPT-linked C1 transfer pathway protein
VKIEVLGWDVGGANVKAARLEGADAPTIVERPFALWREPMRLPEVLTEVGAALGGASRMAVTMTAELADCFATKREGVASVLDAFGAAFPAAALHVFGIDGHFRSAAEARRRPLKVAAANWMATATLVSEHWRDALLIDVGSTTTDIIPIVAGRVVARGRTDPGRLRSGELVYTGLLRTPVSAVVGWVPFRGRRCRVAAEHFAIAADAHLWLGRIDAAEYSCEPPDGRGRSREEAASRLARVICADMEMIGEDDVTVIARHVAAAQTRQIASGVRQVLRRLGATAPRTVVIAGSGILLAREAAAESGLAVCGLDSRLGSAAARAAPAAAVAHLLARELGE